MSRSVVTRGTPRCSHCQFAPRWCVCAGLRLVPCPLPVAILLHRRESRRPTSTGRLLQRVVPSARTHLYAPDAPPSQESVLHPGCEPWILHPQGERVPAGAQASTTQVILLDGNWREASRMLRRIESWGRPVALPADSSSRYRLRNQHAEGMYSTAETLILLLEHLGLGQPASELRLQFELHVYAGLRSRGATREAEEFLAASPIPAAMPEILDQLHRRRPNLEALRP